MAQKKNNGADGKKRKKMKIRMACEWKNLGRFAIDHFAISNGWLKNEDPSVVDPQERVEPVHRHYLTCYFKASTYFKSFNRIGGHLNPSGQVLPFAEISEVMKMVLTEWNAKLVCPYSDKLKWKRDHETHAGFQMEWQGSWKKDSVQRGFRRGWEEKGGVAYYKLRENTRLYDASDAVPSWDESPNDPYGMNLPVVKRLSIASKRGTTEEIVRELMMDFLSRLIMTLNEVDLNRVYKMTFRLDEETGKESDFGAEISLKGRVDDVVNAWEKQLILQYAEKLGWRESLDILRLHDASYSWDARLRREMEKMFGKEVADKFSKRIKRTMFIRTLRQSFSEEDEKIDKAKPRVATRATKKDFLGLYNAILKDLDAEAVDADQR